MIGADLVGGVGKPAPDVYLRACADLAPIPPAPSRWRTRPTASPSAKAAGMTAVAVPSRITRFNDFAQADLVVDSVADLTVPLLDARRPGDRNPARR